MIIARTFSPYFDEPMAISQVIEFRAHLETCGACWQVLKAEMNCLASSINCGKSVEAALFRPEIKSVTLSIGWRERHLPTL